MKNNPTKFKETEIGLIPEEWGFDSLGNHCKILGGKRLPKEDSLINQRTDHPYIRITDLGDFGVNESGLKYISDETHAKIKKYIIESGDIYISNVGTVGLVGLVKDNLTGANLTENAVRLTKLSGLNNLFLGYYLKSESGQNQIRQNTVGAVQPKLPIYGVENINLPIPELTEQKQITEILSSLDDKIELNRQINANLEKMISALFKRWFVDFEFPFDFAQGRPAENGKPYKSSGGKMVESEMGEVPEGWRAGTLGDEFEIVMGQSPEGSTYNEDETGLPFYQGRTDFGFRFPSRRVYCTKPTRIAKPLDTLISVRAPVGAINMASEECCIGRGVGAIRKNGYSSYTFYTIKFLQNQIAQFDSEGTIFGSINKDSLSNISLIVPEMSIAIEFEKMTCNTDEQIMTLSQEVASLTTIRDSLLPRLMSGKIRVNI